MERMNEGDGVSGQKGSRDPLFSLSEEKTEVCAVCTTRLNSSAEPKLLPCLHMMCKACIVVHISEDKRAKGCPMCGQSFSPSEVTDCFIFEKSAPKCGGCDESTISGWCKECEEALCSDCVSAHQRVKVTRNHAVIPQEPQSGLSTSLHCTSHKQERLKFFCVTCDQLTCRDCQLIDHRNHRFLLLQEAVVSQKDHLMKLLESIREEKNSVRTSLQDVDRRLNDLKNLKASSMAQLHTAHRTVYAALVLQFRNLAMELEGLCDAEKKSLKLMKTRMKKLENSQDYLTAFINKMLSCEGQCILRHKVQIEKWTQRVLSQKNLLPDTVIQLSLLLNQNISHIIKNIASVKVTRVFKAKGKCKNGDKPKNTSEEVDKHSSGLDLKCAATVSDSDTTSLQDGAHSMPQAATDVPPYRQSTESAQTLKHSMSHPGSLSISYNVTPHQTSQSNTPQCVVGQVGHHLPQSVSSQPLQMRQPLQSTSVLQSSPSVLGQTALNINSSNVPQQSNVIPQAVIPQSQSGVVVPTSAPLHIAYCPSLAQTPVLSSLQSLYLNNLIDTQLRSILRNQSVPSPHTVSPSSQPIHYMSNPHPSTQNSLSNPTQQSIIHQSQALSGQSFPSQIAPTNNSQPVSNTQPVDSQPCQSAGTESNHSPVTQFKNAGEKWKFHDCSPVVATNSHTTITCVPQPKENVNDTKFSQPISKKVSLPTASRLTDLPVSSNKELYPTVSSMSSHTADAIPSVNSNTGQKENATQMTLIPTCELTVKALADSVSEGDRSVCSRASPVAEEADSNLPTSTVQEKAIQPKELQAVHQGPLSVSSVKDCLNIQSIFSHSESPVKSRPTLSSTGSSSTKDWLKGLPTSFREILSNEKKVPAEEACSDSTLEQTCLPNAQTEEEEKTDDYSELVEVMDESEENPILQQDSNKTLTVSLPRLPISGSSQFRIVPSGQNDDILLEETEENQSFHRYFIIPAPLAASSLSQMCSSENSLQVEVLDCVVCLSAGALLKCAKCGRSFHTSCHVPPIIFSPIAVWTCSLCQDVLDDIDPFSCDRLEEPNLNLSDQRRCEQLLLTIMCENHSYLLYKTKKTTSCVEFNLIVGRLLGKCSPPYRSAAEMVSDVWALFDNLSNSKKKYLVLKLQNSFQQRVNALFGNILHSSLLRPLSSGDQMVAPETDHDGEKAKKTLKRMREFLAGKCAVMQKKAHTVNT